jgi:hypothetical protein
MAGADLVETSYQCVIVNFATTLAVAEATVMYGDVVTTTRTSLLTVAIALALALGAEIDRQQ